MNDNDSEFWKTPEGFWQEVEVRVAMLRLENICRMFERADVPLCFAPRPYDHEREGDL